MPFGWSNQVLPGASASMFVKMLNEVMTPQLNTGADSIYFFPPEKNNYSKYCEQAVYHVPGIDPDILTQACGNGLHNRIPVGELIGVQPMKREIGEHQQNCGYSPPLHVRKAGQHGAWPGVGRLGGEDVDVMTRESRIGEQSASVSCRSTSSRTPRTISLCTRAPRAR